MREPPTVLSDGTTANLCFRVTSPEKKLPEDKDLFDESQDNALPSAEAADAYMMSRIVLQLKNEPVFSAGFRHFGVLDIKPEQYIFRLNQACVYIAKASRRGIANRVICNPSMREFFDTHLQPEKLKSMTFEITGNIPNKMALMYYKGQNIYDFPLAYNEASKKLYINKKYLDYFALIDLTV
jgi:hypothetical protein